MFVWGHNVDGFVGNVDDTVIEGGKADELLFVGVESCDIVYHSILYILTSVIIIECPFGVDKQFINYHCSLVRKVHRKNRLKSLMANPQAISKPIQLHIDRLKLNLAMFEDANCT